MSNNESVPPVAPQGDTAKCASVKAEESDVGYARWVDLKERLEALAEKVDTDNLPVSTKNLEDRCDEIWGVVNMIGNVGIVVILAMCMFFVRLEYHGKTAALTGANVLETKANINEMFAKLSDRLEELSKKLDAYAPRGKSVLSDLHAELEAAAKQKQIIEDVIKRPPAEEVRGACRVIADAINSVPVPHRFFIFPSSAEGKNPSAYETSFGMYACLSCSSPDVFPAAQQFEEARRRIKVALGTKARVYEANRWAMHDGWEEEADRAMQKITETYEKRCAPVA